jgi:hypothetical protein
LQGSQAYDRVLKFDYRGAPQTVGLIGRTALEAQNDYSVREVTEAVCSGLPGKDFVGEYQAIYYFLIGPRVRYMRDPRTVELVRSPQVISKRILSGQVANLDCDDMSGQAAAMVLACGGQPRLVTVAFRPMFHKGQRQYSHVFCEAKDPRSGLWIAIDPVAGRNTGQMMRRIVHAKTWPIA